MRVSVLFSDATFSFDNKRISKITRYSRRRQRANEKERRKKVVGKRGCVGG